MEKQDTKNLAHKRRNKKLLLLFIMFGITIIGCVYTTYAWFVGIGSVKINNFTINLETDPSLEISLDGYTWDENITVTENTIKGHNQGGSAYNTNTNSWVGEHGLVPVSSSGDNTGGKLDIFTKTSMDPTETGFRLTADKIDNSSKEKDYYVAFDIFVKNKTGDVYNTEYNLLDDENIYLTTDSSIIGTANGATSYGVQNSARVAFIQIGRIDIDDLVTGTTPVIKCDTPSSGDTYTPLCNNNENHYRTMIWEPNELEHDTRALNYYNLVCESRVSPWDGCTEFSSDYYVPTYTVKQQIESENEVEIYDGLNYYDYDIAHQAESINLLQNTVTFTDEMKNTGGEATFMKLHPHSVTKIRVYIYLEGQDIDNYDLITNDLNIQVNFGFTKERTYTDEITDDRYFERYSVESVVTNKIPIGCMYTRADGLGEYTEGMIIPSDYTPQTGDQFEDGDYVYKYKEEYIPNIYSSTGDWDEIEMDGWGVVVKNQRKSSYTDIANSILNKPVVSLRGTFSWLDTRVTIPNIPDTIINMNGMFYRSYGPSLINVQNWDTSNVIDMSYMFFDATTDYLNLDLLDTSNVTNMSHMFDEASCFNQFTDFTLDISNWNTSNVEDMSYMFKYAFSNNYESVELNLNNWNTSNVKNMSSTFQEFGVAAESLNLYINNWNTSSVTNMNMMFFWTHDNLNLNLSGWNVNNVTNHSDFRGSANIVEPIWVP